VHMVTHGYAVQALTELYSASVEHLRLEFETPCHVADIVPAYFVWAKATTISRKRVVWVLDGIDRWFDTPGIRNSFRMDASMNTMDWALIPASHVSMIVTAAPSQKLEEQIEAMMGRRFDVVHLEGRFSDAQHALLKNYLENCGRSSCYEAIMDNLYPPEPVAGEDGVIDAQALEPSRLAEKRRAPLSNSLHFTLLCRACGSFGKQAVEPVLLCTSFEMLTELCIERVIARCPTASIAFQLLSDVRGGLYEMELASLVKECKGDLLCTEWKHTLQTMAPYLCDSMTCFELLSSRMIGALKAIVSTKAMQAKSLQALEGLFEKLAPCHRKADELPSILFAMQKFPALATFLADFHNSKFMDSPTMKQIITTSGLSLHNICGGLMQSFEKSFGVESVALGAPWVISLRTQPPGYLAVLCESAVEIGEMLLNIGDPELALFFVEAATKSMFPGARRMEEMHKRKTLDPDFAALMLATYCSMGRAAMTRIRKKRMKKLRAHMNAALDAAQVTHTGDPRALEHLASVDRIVTRMETDIASGRWRRSGTVMES